MEAVQVVPPRIRVAVEREQVPRFARAHRVADGVAADRPEQIQVCFQPVGRDVRVVEQVVLIAAAQEQHRLALVLPVVRVAFIRPDGVVGMHRRRREHRDEQKQRKPKFGRPSRMGEDALAALGSQGIASSSPKDRTKPVRCDSMSKFCRIQDQNISHFQQNAKRGSFAHEFSMTLGWPPRNRHERPLHTIPYGRSALSLGRPRR